MFLKCETTNNVYKLKSKNIFCRVKVVSTKVNNNKNESSTTNTCRSITTDQWNEFDNELISWLVHNENNALDGEKTAVCQFIVKPNLQINIKKSKLAIRDFLKCVNTDDDDCYGAGSSGEYGFPFILDCILEQTSMPSTTKFCTEEYEPLPAISMSNSSSISSLPYAPYIPSKRARRCHSEIRLKTPPYKITGYNAIEDKYSPQPIIKNSSINNIAQYKPAPICRRTTSCKSEMSTQNDVIIETEAERMSYGGYRSKLKQIMPKSSKAIGEYVPQTSLIESHDVPTYKPSPIEVVHKSAILNPDDIDAVIGRKAEGTCNDKNKPQEHKKSSKEHKKKEKRHSKEYAGENGNKRSSKEKLCSDSKESKKISIVDNSEAVRGQNKENYKEKARVDLAEIDKRQGSKQKYKDKMPTKIKHPSLLSSDAADKATSSQKREVQYKDRSDKEKDKEKKKRNDGEEAIKSYENKSLNKPKDVPIGLLDNSLIRRSERMPAKPKRFIEEQEQYELRKKQKIKRLTPLKSKELFGTDDEDEDDDMPKLSDTNNNGTDINSVLQNTSLSLSAIPSFPIKIKCPGDNTVQDKANITKYLDKKPSSKTADCSDKISKEDRSSSKDKSLLSTSSQKNTSMNISKEDRSSSKDKSLLSSSSQKNTSMKTNTLKGEKKVHFRPLPSKEKF